MVLLTKNYLMQGFTVWLTCRGVPTGSHKHLFFPWHGLKITRYLLLTINCPCSTQLILTFHLTRIHHNCLSKGVAKSDPTGLLQSVSTPVEALCDGTPGETFRTGARAPWYTQRTRSTRKLSDLPYRSRVEGPPREPQWGQSSYWERTCIRSLPPIRDE